jgi:hypothetical protein
LPVGEKCQGGNGNDHGGHDLTLPASQTLVDAGGICDRSVGHDSLVSAHQSDLQSAKGRATDAHINETILRILAPNRSPGAPMIFAVATTAIGPRSHHGYNWI